MRAKPIKVKSRSLFMVLLLVVADELREDSMRNQRNVSTFIPTQERPQVFIARVVHNANEVACGEQP